MTELTQLARLAKPFPSRLVKTNPSGGGEYVKHSTVNEKLLAVCGPYSFTVSQVIRGHVAEIAPNPNGSSRRAKTGAPALADAVVGVVCRLSVEIDGRLAEIEEAGDCEDPHNWPHDGARLKDAMSDAFKRCAMRVGVGLHLWSQESFSLFAQLTATDRGEGEAADGRAPEAEPSPRASKVPPVLEPGDAPVVLDAIEDLAAYSSAPM